ncbi:MAG: hypothetical protein ABI903_14505, partial [Actinomycetota bacterium]
RPRASHHGAAPLKNQEPATQTREQPQEEPAASAGPEVAPFPTSGRQHERSADSYSPEPSHGIGR